MEQTALRPKPMPGQEPGPDGGGGGGGCGGGTSGRPGGSARRPHAARRRGRRLTTLLFSLFVGTVLVLAGVGLGTVGATVIGMSKLAELQKQSAAQGAPGRPSPSAPSASPEPSPAVATLGVEIADAEKAGAKVVAVHVPGPGYTAGLVRGDVLLWFGRTRIESATDLARAVAEARPGKGYKVTVRHRSGGYQQLMVMPGVVT